MNRKIVPYILSVLILAMTGCTGHTGEEKKMLNYMMNKYHEEFAYGESCYGQIGSSYVTIHVRSRLSDHVLVRAANINERYSYQDNYLCYLLKEDIQRIMQEIAEEVYGQCKVFYIPPDMVLPEELTAEATADDLLRNPNSMNKIYIYLPTTYRNTEENLEALRLALKKRKYCIYGVLSCPWDDIWYQKIEDSIIGQERYLGYQAAEEITFCTDEEGNFKRLDVMGKKESRD